ncbi:lipin, HAD-like domain, LNS2/PITP [Artemisia annua]|uniref:Lipin, HAD-like domain, LNS2/PITP n=1 Tax=Artemisia annua TaxID=35608 RepID=A0A2U1M9Z0_ARTAN|nr:lipin, HAD-like domain, LNS2/PITP [Artemisia annua]
MFGAEGVSCSSIPVPFIQTVEESLTKEVDETNEIRTTLESNGESQDVPGDAVLIKEVCEQVVEEQLFFNDLANWYQQQPLSRFTVTKADVVDETVDEESLKTQLDDTNEPEVGLIAAQESLEIVPESYAEVGSNQGDACEEGVSWSSISVPFIQTVEESLTKEVDETNEIRTTLESKGEFHDVLGDAVLIKEIHLQSKHIKNDRKLTLKELNVNTFRRCPTYVDIHTNHEITEKNVLRHSKSLPNMRSHVDNITPDNLEEPQFYSPVSKFRSSNWDLIREDALRIKIENLEKQLSQSGDNMSKDSKMVAFQVILMLILYRRLMEKKKIVDMHSSQVDARIYMWSWDTRIVISDVEICFSLTQDHKWQHSNEGAYDDLNLSSQDAGHTGRLGAHLELSTVFYEKVLFLASGGLFIGLLIQRKA